MKRSSSFIRYIAAATITVGLALSAFGVAAQEKVRLAINVSPISALPLIAQKQGFFAKHDVNVVISNFTSGRQALETVLGGGAEIATAAEAPVTAAMFSNQRVALLARMTYSNLKTLVVAPGYRNPADLRGKRLGYTAGTGSEVYTHALLKRLGLNKSDVTLVNLRPQDMIAAAASNSIDAYSIWEPFISNGRKILGDKARIADVENVYAETFNVVVTEEYARRHVKSLTAFLAALLDAERWLKANREEAITLVATAVNMKREDLADVWDDYVFELVLDQRTLDVLRDHAQWRIDTGNAAGGATVLPDLRSAINSDPLKAAAPDRVRI